MFIRFITVVAAAVATTATTTTAAAATTAAATAAAATTSGPNTKQPSNMYYKKCNTKISPKTAMNLSVSAVSRNVQSASQHFPD
jgi:curli biogenesis system outer membrane secretion channel CsgG